MKKIMVAPVTLPSSAIVTPGEPYEHPYDPLKTGVSDV